MATRKDFVGLNNVFHSPYHDHQDPEYGISS